jgi:hypothetical protein
MKNIFKPNMVCSLLILSIVLASCRFDQARTSTFAPPKSSTPISTAITNDADFLVMKTNDPDFRAVSIHKNGEVLAAMTESGPNNTITSVKGAVYMSPKGEAVTIFLGADGLPARAVVAGKLVRFANYTDKTVDITVVSSDGSLSENEKLPINEENIRWLRDQHQVSQGTSHLMKINSTGEKLSARDALKMASIGFGIFSCAATFATGGTLGVLFGIGCASTLVGIWMELHPADNVATLDAVSGGQLIVGSFQCAGGVIASDPMSVADCAALITDAADNVLEVAETTQQQLGASGETSKSPESAPQIQLTGHITLWKGGAFYRMDADGNVEELFQHPGPQGRLSCSSDGTKLAFESKDGILVSDDHGTILANLTPVEQDPKYPKYELGYPSISPDGNQVALCNGRDRGLYIADLSGNLSKLPPVSGTCYDILLQWAPDGKRFISERVDVSFDDKVEVFMADVANQTIANLSNGPVTVDVFVGWLPGRKQILVHARGPQNDGFSAIDMDTGEKMFYGDHPPIFVPQYESDPWYMYLSPDSTQYIYSDRTGTYLLDIDSSAKSKISLVSGSFCWHQ